MTYLCPPLCFLGGTVGAPEIALIIVVIFVFFGPRSIPQAARTLGRLTSKLRRLSREFTDQLYSLDREITSGGEIPPEYTGTLQKREKPPAAVGQGERKDGPAG